MKTMRSLAALLLALMLLCAFGAADTVENLSPTTGLPTDKAYTPFAVQLDNAAGARPQVGLASADVIYESEVQNGGYTRYTAVFNDNFPALVEAVRSARILHADLASDWNAQLVHYGGQSMTGTNVFEYFTKNGLSHVDGIGTGGIFYRDSARTAPHNVACKLAELAEQFAVDTEVKAPLHFSADAFTQQGEEVSSLEIVFKTGYKPGFAFNPNDGLYYRFYEREQQLDGATGEPLTASNIIIQYVEYSYYDYDGSRPVADLLNSKGLCTYFINGLSFNGTWRREGIDSATRYFDAKGNEVVFKPGVTYIEILREGKEVITG